MIDEKHKNFFMRVYDLYNKFGIKSVTMDDIARELGMSKKTVYECIKDKAQLVEQVLHMVYEHHAAELHAISDHSSNAIEELFRVNVYMDQLMKEQNHSLLYDLRKYYPEVFRKLLTEQRERMQEAIRTNLEKGIKQGLYRKDMNIDVISKIHMSRMEYRHSNDTFAMPDFNSQEVMREIFIYHMHGIASEAGIIELNKQIKQYWK